MNPPVRVLVADDHRLFRQGVRGLLAVSGEAEVVGEAGDTATAIALAAELLPDVVLMDLHMPRGGGLTATAEIASAHPEIAVLVLTMIDDGETVLAAIRSGARGYVLKDTEAEDLLRAVLAAAHGEAIFGAGVAARLLDRVGGRALPVTDPFSDLTDSERSVLRLMARGLANAEIGRTLSLSEKTVRNYVSTVFRKLGVTNRTSAVVLARRAGLHR